MDMKSKWRNILVVLGLVIAVVLLIDFNRRMEELNRLSAELESVRAEGTSIMETRAALEAKIAIATSDDFVEPYIRGIKKMVGEGEHPIVLVPKGNPTATPEPMRVIQTETYPNWRTWWELFFGDS
jgi:cell division protein FtsB